ncbi:hypothetical protein [Clostridium sp. DMHC 10]|nr:hypothetical protein [Clostridium sp. DMHC 10]
MIGGEYLMEGGPDTRRKLVLKRRKRQMVFMKNDFGIYLWHLNL